MKRNTSLFRGFARRISALILPVCLLLSACGTQAEEAAPALMENNNLNLPTITVKYGDVYNIDYATGGIHPYSERLNFTSAGWFDCFKVVSGQQVKQGDVLAQLDNSVKQAQLDSLKENLKYFQDTADLELTTLNLAYQQVKEEQAQLQASGAPDYALEVKSIEAWEAWMDIEHAEQNHELQFGELEEQVRKLEEELTLDTRIIAPFDGTVIWLNSTVEKGDYLTEDMPIVAISSNDRLYIISEFMTDTYRTYCERIYAKIGDQEFDLTMRERDLKADVANNRAGYSLISEYDFVDELPTGIDISGNALIVFLWNYHPNVLYLPNELVYQGTDGYYVNRVVDNKIVQTDVEIGSRSPLETVILSGLKEGDVVYAKQ